MASARKPRGLPQRCSLGHAKSDIHRLDGLSCHSLAQIVERDHHCGGVLIRGHANVRKIGSCHCRNPRASFYDSNEWTIGERRSSTSVQRRCRKCVPIPVLQRGKDPSDERPTMRHKSKRTLDIACCHRHLDLSDVMMCQNFVGAEVICACRMMRGRDWAGTATAGTSHSAGSEEVNLQSSKRQERELQSSRETTRSGNSFRALDSSAIPFRKTVHKPRQQLRTWMFRSIQVLEYARIRDSKIRREIDEDHAPSHTGFRRRRCEPPEPRRPVLGVAARKRPPAVRYERVPASRCPIRTVRREHYANADARRKMAFHRRCAMFRGYSAPEDDARASKATPRRHSQMRRR